MNTESTKIINALFCQPAKFKAESQSAGIFTNTKYKYARRLTKYSSKFIPIANGTTEIHNLIRARLKGDFAFI